jgi:hypothetical protein
MVLCIGKRLFFVNTKTRRYENHVLTVSSGVVATIKKGFIDCLYISQIKEMDMNTPSINPHKSRYKVRNRQAYNTGLSKRGSLTLFLSDELLKEWSSPVSGKQAAGEPGYPQCILQCCLSVRRLPPSLPSECRVFKSLFRLAGKESLPVPV